MLVGCASLLIAQGTWTQMANFGGSARKQAIAFTIGDKGYIGTGISTVALKDFWEYNPSTGTWAQKSDFGGVARWTAAGFSIGDKGYIGTGYNGTGSVKDFWEYNPAINTWTRKADFGGTARYGAVGLSIDNKGYIGTGVDGAWRNDFWEYDPASDTWTQKSNFGGVGREVAVGFAIGNMGYVGTGYTIGVGYKDFWQYDPSTDVWTKKADFGGGNRIAATGFSLNGKGYIGTGEVPYQQYETDWWEYDPAIDTWSPKSELTGAGRYMAVAFAIVDKGYLGTGITHEGVLLNDFWQYKSESVVPDSWTQVADFGGSARYAAVGFSIVSKGYIGTGYDGSYLNDFWEYDPAADVWSQKADFSGIERVEAVGFGIGNKGYVGVGVNASTSPWTYPTDFWEYNPGANTWTKKADFPAHGRQSATGFAVNGKGYIGTGVDKLYGDNFYKDFYQYDPSTNTWSKRADFGGGYRSNPRGFAVGDKGYIGTGYYGGWKNDFWQYDPSTDTWIKKADFGGTPREWAVGFSILDRGYLGTGFNAYTWLQDFWEFDPVANSWTQRADFGGGIRAHAIGFSIGDKGYLGTGEVPNEPMQNDLWQYTPGGTTACAVPVSLNTTKITSTTAKLDWDEISGALGYGVRYKIIGDKEWTLKTATTSSRKIEGLQPGADYIWSVRTYCTYTPPAVTSQWSPNQTFTTAPLRLEAPVSNSLSVYPNPFQQSATITYSTVNDASVQIALYDLSGKLMKRLLTEHASSGIHTLSLNSEGLAQGIYLLKFQVNDELIVQKVVIE
jgi:N-acetylneuraminic acid mutarotase